MNELVSRTSKRAAGAALAILVSLTLVPRANAQDTATSEPSAEPAPGAVVETPATTEAPAEAAVAPAEEPVVTAEPVAMPEVVAEEEEVAATEPEAEASSWTDNLSFRVFADAYVAAHWTLPNGFEGNQSAIIGHRAYDIYGGPSLAWAGLDLRYAPDPLGAAIDLRFGTAVPRLLGAFSGLPEGLQFLKQAYVSWRPIENFQIDFGQFDTIYGAEVSESWLNPNYSRGSLYNVVQPFYHMGFRASYAVIPELTLTAIAVNGWNNVSDNNDGKSVGIQGALTVGDFSVALGYLTGPEQSDCNAIPGPDDPPIAGCVTDEDLGDHDGRFRHLVDLILRYSVGDLALVANGDVTIEDFGPAGYTTIAGGMIGAQYRFIPEFALALRGEVLYFEDTDESLTTGTFTIEVAPDPHLVFRLDNRLDVSSYDQFVDNSGQPSELVFSSILGVVAHSD
ncbi:porin [Sandaracinus amylolyticus]|uniref:Porin n=1 Tax=Sandaracinus amylolyticus TaxID=927083 RepID=A0A0F6W7W9_9BACT|nr:porin [Sandaracinus amylolyticus]AKF09756.1 hypothetical protein DB32_006905 [Sandaracinus amylolyticus]